MKVVITGCNRGIGLELAKQYSLQGAKIYGLCRESSVELSELPNTHVISGVDVTGSYLKLAGQWADNSIDLLIHNAGIFKQTDLDDFRPDDVLEQFKVNALAPLTLTQELLPKLKEGGKVAIVTSRMGSIGDNTSGGYYGYRMSKAAANAMGKSLSLDLRPRKISVALLHPGYVQTGMTGGAGDITADVAALGMIKVITSLDLSKTGRFWHSNGEELPW